MYKFEKLKVWKESLLLVKDVYKLCLLLPRSEERILIDQVKRAAISICLNIAEGSGAENDKEFNRYLNVAQKSLYEVVAVLKIIEFQYNIDTDEIQKRIDPVGRMLNGLKKYLKTGLSSDSRLKTND